MIKTFRGIIGDNEQIRIRLSTKKGKVGYRIVKFQVLPNNLNSSGEACMKIFKITQSSNTFAFDFSDGNLLAAAYYTVNASADAYSEDHHVIFDQEIFNQDIYITHKNNDNVSMNYYIELEVMSLTDNAAAVSTLRDIRLNPQVGG